MEPRPETDRYQFVRVLGEGASGRVSLVHDRQGGNIPLALKELSERSEAERLRGEFALLTTLRHPGLIRVHEFDIGPTGLPRFSMEFVEGADFVTATRGEPASDFLRRVAEVLRALSFLHDFGYLHRDIKPPNLLVRDSPQLGSRVVLLDFGLALTTTAPGPDAHLAGTLPYLAPELFTGEPPTARSDLYGLGAVLFEALHGRPPFPLDPDLTVFLEKVRNGSRPLTKLPPGFPREFSDWIDAMLAPDPTFRPATASEALARLNENCGTDFALETQDGRGARLASGAPPGRDLEVRRIWTNLKSPEKRLTLVTGSAGAGKSRILRWVGAEAVRRGWQPVTASGPDQRAPQSAESRLLHLVEDLAGRAAEHDILLILDDVESDEDRTALALESFTAAEESGRLKILAALRHEEARHPWFRSILRDSASLPSVARVDLAPLNDRCLAELVVRASGAGAASETRVAWLRGVSEGNALLAQMALTEEAWDRPVGARPRFLHDAVARRLTRLSPTTRSWVEALAIFGEAVPQSWLIRLSGNDPSAAGVAQVEAAASGFSRDHGHMCAPQSKMTADEIVRSIPPERRRELHSRAAELLAEYEATVPERLARHYAGAGQSERAIECAVRAATRAAVAGYPGDASDHYTMALRLLRRRDPRWGELRLAQGRSLQEARRITEAVRAYAGAIRFTQSQEDRLEARIRLARAFLAQDRPELAEESARLALAEAQQCGLPIHQLRAQKELAGAYQLRHQMQQGRDLLIAAAKGFRTAGETFELAETLFLLGWGAIALGLASATSSLAEARALCRRHGYQRLELDVLVYQAESHAMQGEILKASEMLVTARELAVETRNNRARINATSKLGAMQRARGNLDAAQRTLGDAEQQAIHSGSLEMGRICRIERAAVVRDAGRPSEAASILRGMLQGNMGRLSNRRRDFVRLNLAEALLSSTSPAGAEAQDLLAQVLRDSHERDDRIVYSAALLLDLELRVGQSGEESSSEVVHTLLGEEEDLRGFTAAFVRARRLLAIGRHYFHIGEIATCLEYVRRALEQARRMDSPAEVALAESLLSEAYEKDGKLDEAREALERGRAKLEEAAQRIGDPDMRRDFLARPVFRRLRDPKTLREGDDARMEAMYEMIDALHDEEDLDKLLPAILDTALNVVRAERGMILLLDPESGEFGVRVARELERETAEDAESFSQHVVSRAGGGESVLAIDTGQDDRFKSLKSVSLFGIRSLMCVPLRCRGEIAGTVYVDSRKHGALFSRADLEFLEAFADHAGVALHNARERERLEGENRRLRGTVRDRRQFAGMVGRSPAMQAVYDRIEQVAETTQPVLIRGESGTGKELVAAAIHRHGGRSDGPFITENCAAVPETLLESELFGHVKGAFTGAERDRVGVFEQADGGTLFLDEVGDMSPAMQARLLRVLQEGELRRVGSNLPVRVDVRVLAATHRDLEAEVEKGTFREDLFYRLQVLEIELPPLRERPGDVPLLVEHFLARIAESRGREAPKITPEVLDRLERHAWPGNVRQLENLLQRLVLLAGEGDIDAALIASEPELEAMLADQATAPEAFSLEADERERIRLALEQAGGNRTRAAQLLGISRATIYRKIKDYDLA